MTRACGRGRRALECAVWRPVTRIVLFASLALFYVLGSSLLGRDWRGSRWPLAASEAEPRGTFAIAYIQRRLEDGKTRREANRCLKRYLARNLYRLLEHPPMTT